MAKESIPIIYRDAIGTVNSCKLKNKKHMPYFGRDFNIFSNFKIKKSTNTSTSRRCARL